MEPIDVVGCEASLWVCVLQRWGGDPVAWLVFSGFFVACALLLVLQWRRDASSDASRQLPRRARTTHVVAGPELQDGSWVRLVEYAPGLLRAEVYSDRRWVVLHRDPSKFFEAAQRSGLRLPTR